MCDGTQGVNHSDAKYWLCEKKLTNAVQAQVGFSFFLPTTFDYRLPK